MRAPNGGKGIVGSGVVHCLGARIYSTGVSVRQGFKIFTDIIQLTHTADIPAHHNRHSFYHIRKKRYQIRHENLFGEKY